MTNWDEVAERSRKWAEESRERLLHPQWRLECVNGSCKMSYVSDRPHYGDICGSSLFCVGAFGGPAPQAPRHFALWGLPAGGHNEAASPDGSSWRACRMGP